MRILLLAVFLITISFSCTKISSTDIGSGLIPPVDNVNTFDTSLLVETQTFYNNFDPVVYKQDEHVIGVLNDPVFGKTTASLFVELKPTSYKYSLPIKRQYRVADSAVLVLSFTGVYGDSSAPSATQQWEVRELNELLEGDTAYRTSFSPSVGNLLTNGAATIDVRRLGDSVINRFERTKNQVRIKLSSATAQRFINNYDSTNAYFSDSAFRDAFKGFAIVPQQGSGNALVRVNLLNLDTKLALYYHKDSANIHSDTTVSYFRFSTLTDQTSANANRIVRDYNGSELATAVGGPGNAAKVYAQTTPGTYITVNIPGLANLSNRIIHRAELVAFQEGVDNDPLATVLTPPSFLFLGWYDTAFKGLANLPHDFELTQNGPNFETSGGYLHYQNIPGFTKRVGVYNFNMSRYVQGIITRREKVYPLRIYAPSNDSLRYTFPYPNNNNSVTVNLGSSTTNRMAHGRVRLAGGAHPDPRIQMRLRIIFSRI